MTIFFDYLIENYIDLIIELCFSILCVILLLINNGIKQKKSFSDSVSSFLALLPSLIAEANILYPESKSGPKKFDYVVGVVSKRFPSIPLRLIQQSVNNILSADRVPEGGVKVETLESETEKRSEDFRQDCESDFRTECSAETVQRRNTFIK